MYTLIWDGWIFSPNPKLGLYHYHDCFQYISRDDSCAHESTIDLLYTLASPIL